MKNRIGQFALDIYKFISSGCMKLMYNNLGQFYPFGLKLQGSSIKRSTTVWSQVIEDTSTVRIQNLQIQEHGHKWV